VADTRLRSGFDPAAWAAEQLRGVSYLFFLRELERRVEDDWPVVLNDLESIRQDLIHRDRTIVNATLPESDWADLAPCVGELLSELPGPPTNFAPWEPSGPNGPEGLTIPSKVNYVAKGADLYGAGYQLHGSIAVIANHLRAGYLWDRVRVQGGAYGAFCSLDIRSGVFSFGSYRDPNLEKTLQVYDAAAAHLRTVSLTPAEITQHIIGAIGSIDAYRLPDAKGYTSLVRHLTGETDLFRQQFRDEVLSTELSHFREFADALETIRGAGATVVIGSAEAIRQAQPALGSGLTITKVL
jgi:Zn-dependent M16 (insulinase) family peptidase